MATLDPRQPLPLSPSSPEQEGQARGEEDASYWIAPEAALALVLENLVRKYEPTAAISCSNLTGGKDLRGGSTHENSGIDVQIRRPPQGLCAIKLGGVEGGGAR